MIRAEAEIRPVPNAPQSLLGSFMSLSLCQPAALASYNFINPTNGAIYPYHDLLTPIRDIYLIFNNTNVSCQHSLISQYLLLRTYMGKHSASW